MNFFRTAIGRPMIGAHRGCRSIRPENTRCAFDASIGRCDFIELDVQMSRDGIPVVHHDNILGRTSDAKQLGIRLGKQSLRVDHWHLDELRRLDVGSWFLAADPFSTISAGVTSLEELHPLMPQRIMTLAELVEWSKRQRMPLNIELKDQHDGPHDQTIVDRVLAVIHAASCTDSILISSFRHDYLRQVKERMADLPVGVLQQKRHPDNLLAYLAEIGAEAYHPDADLASGELIAELRQQGIAVNVFTVNSKALQKRLFEAGATAVFTDFPDRFAA